MKSTTKLWISKHIPIWGPLVSVKPKAILEALVELALTVIFSTLPIWLYSLTPAVSSYVELNSDTRAFGDLYDLYISSARNTIKNAEMFIYVTSTLGPTLYLGLTNFGNPSRPYPWVRMQLVCSILLGIVATIFFMSVRNTPATDDNFLIILSVAMYLIALSLLFPAMAFNQERTKVSVEDIQRDDQNNFQAGYGQHRSGV